MDIARQRRRLFATACIVGLWAAVPAAALADRDRDRDRRGGRDDGGYGSRLSLDSAVNLVLSRFGGQVVKAETQARDGQLFYQIRVLTPDGTLMRVRVNALTGRMD